MDRDVRNIRGWHHGGVTSPLQTATATLHTNRGDIVIALFGNHAPKTVENFVGLADGSKEYKTANAKGEKSGPFYDGAIFHRVIDGFMAQTGDPTGTGQGGSELPDLTAEFNAFCDPEAVRIVLDAFPESTMLSWETTLKHSFSWEQYDSLSQLGTDLASFFGAITGPTIAFLRQFPQVPGYLLPDPLAMAIALDPGLITASEHLFVTMELQGALTRGQTVIDRLGVLGRAPNTYVVTDLDTDGVYRMYERMLGA